MADKFGVWNKSGMTGAYFSHTLWDLVIIFDNVSLKQSSRFLCLLESCYVCNNIFGLHVAKEDLVPRSYKIIDFEHGRFIALDTPKSNDRRLCGVFFLSQQCLLFWKMPPQNVHPRNHQMKQQCMVLVVLGNLFTLVNGNFSSGAER